MAKKPVKRGRKRLNDPIEPVKKPKVSHAKIEKDKNVQGNKPPAPTGRRPSKPVIQNVPVRTKEGRVLREASIKARGVPPKTDFAKTEKRATEWLTQKSKAERKAEQQARQVARKGRAESTQELPRKASSKDVKAALARVGLTPDLQKPKTGAMERLLTKKGYSTGDIQKIVGGIGPIDDFDYRTTFKDGFDPSPYQIAIFDWVRFGAGHGFVRAKAGSGKTTSLLRACKFMKGSVICIAFNKAIQREFESKLVKMGLQGRVRAQTVHAVGFGAIRRHPEYAHVKVAKGREHTDGMLDAIKKPELYEFPPRWRSAVVKLVSLAKGSGVMVTWELDDQDSWNDLIDHYNVADMLENEAEMPQCVEYAKAGLIWSRRNAKRTIDFDDMIWIPLVEKMKFEKFDNVLIDEAQDLSEMRRLIAVALMHEHTRLTAVGDENQAIYGFTGADADSVERIIKKFNCTQLPLTVTYRCAKSIVKEAQRYVPDIQAHENAVDGVVRHVDREQLEKELPALTPDKAVLCRNMKPLVSLAFKLIRLNIPCHVEGRAIGDGLIALAKKWKSAKTVEQLHDRLDKYLTAEVTKLEVKKQDSKIDALKDRIETMYILMDGCEFVTDVVAKIESLFKDTDGSDRRTVTLCTVHRAKGREWKVVYVLGFNKYMPSKWAKQEWEKQQEANLIYVAFTRAEFELVTTDDLEEKAN